MEAGTVHLPQLRQLVACHAGVGAYFPRSQAMQESMVEFRENPGAEFLKVPAEHGMHTNLLSLKILAL